MNAVQTPAIASPPGGLFGALRPQAPDALLSLIGLYRADPRPTKLDLGVDVTGLETVAYRHFDPQAQSVCFDQMMSALARQHGMFAQLPLNAAQVAEMRCAHGVYMAGSGRINLAGLTPATVQTFAEAYAGCLDEAFAGPVRRLDR